MKIRIANPLRMTDWPAFLSGLAGAGIAMTGWAVYHWHLLTVFFVGWLSGFVIENLYRWSTGDIVERIEDEDV